MIIEVIRLKSFVDKLINKIKKTDSRICVGLDPHLDLIPEYILNNAREKYSDHDKAIAMAVLDFNKKRVFNILKN